jgi:nucleoside 2-deoxyribosyltransferase
MNSTRTVYFAGALFSTKDLIGNALLADAIHTASGSRYHCILPQNCEQRETTSKAIRNQDLLLVATCDLGLFHFDGTELDSGTVVEYMVAKFLDIPSVIVRSDFRKSGDDQDFPWNLMLSNFPRTKVVSVDAMAAYQAPLQQSLPKEANVKYEQLDITAKAGLEASFSLSASLAQKIVVSMDQVCSEKSVLSADLLPSVYEWMRKMPGAGFENLLNSNELKKVMARRASLESK